MISDSLVPVGAKMLPAVLLDIPESDRAEWLAIPAPERARVRELFAAFKEIARARNLKAGAVTAALKRHHLGWGWSAKALLNLYWVYRDGGHKPGDHRQTGPIYPAGDWRVLLRTYKAGTPEALPEPFKRWLGEQLAQFKGRTDTIRALYRHVVYEIWLQDQPVPGYGTCTDWCRRAGRARPHPQLVRAEELPAGWTEATFRRALPKAAVVRKQLAHGYLAAHAHQPDQVLTDRAPLLPLQYVFLDDSRPDLRCTWFEGGAGEIVYPLLVLGLDAATGVDVANVAKPRALNEATGGRHGVTQDMALLVVLNTLRKFGLPPWGITFVHENAAACVPPEAKHLLHGIYGDLIRFEATGTVKQKLAVHGFSESGGAPYDKAPIEAFWRILMTQTARLPGSTGPRYDTQPAELKAIEKYTLGLMEKAGGLAEVFAQFTSPLLSFNEAHAGLERALRLLRFRTAHKLQGFDKVKEWRASAAANYQPWETFLALPADVQDAISAVKGNVIERTECPAERFCRLLAGKELTPVDGDLLTWLEGPRFPVKVRDHKITVTRTELSPDAMIFREVAHPLLEDEGRTYEGVLARDGSHLVLSDEGRILGRVAQQGRVSRADTEALHREQGRVAAARKADRVLLADYYLADTDEALAALHARNEAAAAALPAPTPAAARLPKAKAAEQANRQKRRASVDREIAAAQRTTPAPAAPTGGLYDTNDES